MMSETFDEAVERLRRETRLSKQIEELTGYVDKVRRNVPRRLCLLSGEQLALLVGQLRELRGRRVAMQREPDDEINAPADMCCCNVNLQGAPARQFRGGCPLHPAPHLQADNCRGQTVSGPPCGGCERCLSEQYGTGWDDDEIDWEAGPPVRPEPCPPPVKRRPPTTRELNEADGLDPMVLDLPLLPDGPGEHGEPAWARGAPMPGDPSLDCDDAPAEAECRYLGGGECEPVTCPVARYEVPQDGVFCAQCNDLGRCDDENADGGYCDCIAGRTEAGLDAAEEAMARLTPYGEGPTATRSGPLLRCGLYRAALCPVAAGDGQVDCLACEPLSEEPELGCTGVAASWCPVHGECTCAHDCPLHGAASDHAEAPPDPEAIARRLLGELGPELAAVVCVQLLGRLQRREP